MGDLRSVAHESVRGQAGVVDACDEPALHQAAGEAIQAVGDVVEADLGVVRRQLSAGEELVDAGDVVAGPTPGTDELALLQDEVPRRDRRLELAHADLHHAASEAHRLDGLGGGGAESGEVDDHVEVLVREVADRSGDAGDTELVGEIPHLLVELGRVDLRAGQHADTRTDLSETAEPDDPEPGSCHHAALRHDRVV